MRTSQARLRTLLIAVLLLGAVPAVAGVLHSSWRRSAELRNDAEKDTLAEASDAARRLGAIIDQSRRVLRRFAASDAVLSGVGNSCSTLAADMLSMHPDLRNLGAVDVTGRVYCNARGESAQDARVDPQLLADAMATRGVLLHEFPAGTLLPQPVLAAILAVERKDGSPAGTVFATLDFRSIADLAIGSRLPRGSNVTLVDGSGRVVLRDPDRDHWTGRSIVGEPLWSVLQAGDVGQSFEGPELEGMNRLYGAARVRTGADEPEGFLLVGVPADLVGRAETSPTGIGFAWLGGALLLLAGVAWYGVDAVVLRPVRSLTEAASELGAGRLETRSGAGARGAKELALLGRAFDDMAESLERSLGDTRHALSTVRESQGRLGALSRALIASQEAERSQLARELHDEVGQALTAATIDIDALRQGQRDPETRARAEAALEVVKHALDRVRDLSLDLHPSILDDLGLPAALKWYLARQSERSGIATDLRVEGLSERLPRAIEAACFRIAQEAVTNALRHARATHIEVLLSLDDEAIELRVHDDGAGFDVAQARLEARHGESLGLLGMDERAALLGGSVEVTAQPGAGTTVRALLPLAPETAPE